MLYHKQLHWFKSLRFYSYNTFTAAYIYSIQTDLVSLLFGKSLSFQQTFVWTISTKNNNLQRIIQTEVSNMLV